MKTKRDKGMAEFNARAAKARRPILSNDVWTRPAADWIRIAAFAGFNTQELIVRCFKTSRGRRVNSATVERIMGEMDAEIKEKETV